MKNPFHAGSVVVAAMIFAIMASSISAPALLFTQTAIASTEGQSGTTIATGTTTAPTAPNNATTKRVAVGGGNITLSINQFSPQTVEIQPGESVTFFAPEDSFEVHNVMFDLSNGTTISGIGMPFTLPPGELSIEAYTDVAETLLPAPPYNLGEPIIQNMANGTQAIIGFNKVAFYPAVVDQNGNVTYLDETELSNQMLQMEQAYEQGTPMPSPLSASYTIDGTESAVSSGIVLGVNEFRPPQFPFLHNFTVTFSQPGTYEYFCAFHPGMYGQVVVGGNMEGQTSETPTVTSP
jgi:plastocyanin